MTIGTHFTPRQLEILDLIAAGKTDKDIAFRLRVSRRTVGAHLQRLYLANGFHTRAEAVAARLRTRATPEPFDV
jgi:DNA-binding NarL/FixJ family response regulator